MALVDLAQRSPRTQRVTSVVLGDLCVCSGEKMAFFFMRLGSDVRCVLGSMRRSRPWLGMTRLGSNPHISATTLSGQKLQPDAGLR
jgi:hypothetical protein